MVLCVLVLKRLHLLAILCLIWTEKRSSGRFKHGISILTYFKQEASDAQIKSLLTKRGEELADPAVIDNLLRDREANRPQLDRQLGCHTWFIWARVVFVVRWQRDPFTQ